MLSPNGIILIEQEPNRIYSLLFRFYLKYIRRVDSDLMSKHEIHWFAKKSILPSKLPKGELIFHLDYFPILKYLGIHTRHYFPGFLFATYRKIIQKS